MKDLSVYKPYNTVNSLREFREEYNHPAMYPTSYRRILYGKNSYINKGSSPYVADVFRYLSKKLNKPFVDIAYDLLDSEYFGRKNTLADVLIAELSLEYSDKDTKKLDPRLQSTIDPLTIIRLCDLNEDNHKIYDNILHQINEIKNEINMEVK